MQSITYLPLHGGKAPRWLYGRMVKLAGAISDIIIGEFGADELLRRISDPNWFQALACTIGYDWHSSGTTTVTMAALKEALNGSGDIYIAGGKGKAGLETPNEITTGVDLLSMPSDDERFVRFSKLAAKIDSAMVYDNIGIYHHTFAFARSGKWAVVQQAMDVASRKAIRFQIFSEKIDYKDIADEPHSAVASDLRQKTLDLTSRGNAEIRHCLAEALGEYAKAIDYPERHAIVPRIDLGKRGIEAIKNAAILEPKDYTELLLAKGIGRKTLRSLAFVASLIFDKELAYRDPVTYSYNLGGKDGIPFRIDRHVYDSVIESMKDAVDATNIEKSEKIAALKRLSAAMAVAP